MGGNLGKFLVNPNTTGTSSTLSNAYQYTPVCGQAGKMGAFYEGVGVKTVAKSESLTISYAWASRS